MTYNGCYNAEFVNLLRCRLELVTSRIFVHCAAAQFDGASLGDT